MAGRWFDECRVGGRMAHEIMPTVTEISELKESRSRPEAGIVTITHRLLTQCVKITPA